MPAQPQPIHVLFVCTGNICRSPMAEAVFQHMVAEAGLSNVIKADSAGTGAWHVGEPPHHGTRTVLRNHGIAYTHAARQIEPLDFAHFEYIIALDRSHLSDLRYYARGNQATLKLLMDYVPGTPVHDVPDPYYTGGFDEVYTLVSQGCRALLEHIIAEHHLAPRR